MQIDERRRMPLASNGSNNIYPKGALVLEMLKNYLGDQRFWAAIHQYLTTHAFGNAVTDDLRQAVLEATGENLAWFWNEWIYSAGYPNFTVTSTYDAAGKRVTLAATQTQRDTLKADSTGMRYVVPEVFRMPVAVRVGVAGGADVVQTSWVDRREDTIVVNGVPTAPTMIVFDDGNRVLKTLSFDQPTAQLATQLRLDSNIWNRSWVIDQFAERTMDAEAQAALAQAATSSDYFLTRAQAASALGAMPASVAVPALAKAMRDTSSQVREAAVESLGHLGGAEALSLSRAAWKSDNSYLVRAAAFSALVTLDTATRRALIVEGLRTPSYRDAIQNAALGAAVRSGDSTLVGPVHDLVSEQDVPSSALAVMAGRGSRHALDLLISDLNDPHRYVREWTLTAIVRSLGPERGLPALKTAQPTLTYAETKSAVDRIVKQWEQQAPKRGR
jgi:aminopeptidase N